MSFCLYRFMDIDGKIIYIGRTNYIERRILKEHFTDNTHLPNQCYLETEKVEYVEIVNESEEVAYEAILINENRPKYNTQFKDEGYFDVQLPEFKWREFQWEYEGQLEWLKKKKRNIINANDVMLNNLRNPMEHDIRTGIVNVDSGMLISRQSFTLIAGVSGSSKTAYVLNIANYNTKKGKRVLFINLKDSVEDLSMRILSIDSKVPINELLLGKMSDKDWDSCLESIAAKKDTSLFFYNTSGNHWNLDKILLTIKESNADLVIVDDLHMIEVERKEVERSQYVWDKMDYILKSIKILAVQSEIPIIGTYRMAARKVNNKPDHRPMLEDFEYDSLQQYPDNIQLLYRDDLYNQNIESKNMIEIITVKNILNQLYTTKEICLNGIYANIEN